MNFTKRILMFVGFIVLAAVFVALIAPKAAHGLVAALVQVTNTSSNPVPTQAADNNARQAIALSLSQGKQLLSPGQGLATGYFGDAIGPYTVPVGKRLVIESVSGMMQLQPGQKPRDFNMLLSVNNMTNSVLFTPIYMTTDTADIYEFATAFPAYADPGTMIEVACSRYPYTTGLGACYGYLFGHLENIQ